MNKKLFAVLMCLVMVMSMLPSAAIAAETNVTEIATAAQLQAFAQAVNAGDTFAGKTVKLTADITFADGDYWYYNTDEMDTPVSYVIQNFAGTFDGQGHTIHNMQYFNSDTVKKFNDAVRMGLFGVLKGGTVKNVTITGATATLRNNNQIGFLIKTIAAGTVENCHVKNSTVTCDARTAYTGGLIGDIGCEAKLTAPVAVTGCSVDAVKIICDASATYVGKDGPDMIGGFVGGTNGSSYSVTISNCAATNVTMDIAYKSKRCGGFVGYTTKTSVNNCTAVDAVIAIDDYYQSFGGFAGVSAGSTFSECDVVGLDMTGAGGGDVGGFCAYTSTGSSAFDSCSVSGLDMNLEYNGTSGYDVGGFLGYLSANNGVELNGCTVAGDITVTGESTTMKVGELVGDTYSRTVTLDNSTTNVTVEAKEEIVKDILAKSVAQVGNTYYGTLQDAFAAAQAGQTVTLLDDIDLSGWTSVDVKKAIVLDGNGKTVTGLTAPLVCNASADFEIKNLTVSGADIQIKSAEGLDNDTSAAALIQWVNGGAKVTVTDVSVKDSTIKGDGYVAALVGFAERSDIASITVTGGEISGNALTAGGTVGAVVGHTYIDVTVEGVTVSGNTLTSTSDGGTRPDKVGLVVGRVNEKTVSISATVPAGNTAAPGNGTVIGSIPGGAAVITGGSYSVDPTVTGKAGQAASVKEGLEITENADGTFDVEETPAAPEAKLENAGTTLELEGMILIDQFANIEIEGYDQAYIEENGGLLVWTSNPGDNATFDNCEDVHEGLTYYAAMGAYYGQTGGIASKQYADEYYLCIYLKLEDGSYIYTSVEEYSVQMYCKTVIDGNYDAKYKTLCTEMLEYGAAAQLAFGYNTNDLADAILKKEN